MALPEDTPWKGSTQFTLDGDLIEIGMYPHPLPEYVNQRRAELRVNGAMVVAKNYTWSDIEDELVPNPVDYAERAIATFNEYLAHNYETNTEEYDFYVVDFFQYVEMVKGQLVLTDANRAKLQPR